MRSCVFLILAALALPAAAQQRPLPAAAQQQRPSPDEIAVARLPADLQAMLQHLPPREALRKVEFARQNLIALGVPDPSHEQLRATLARVIGQDSGPYGNAVGSASAGATTFPPLSPLVSPYTPAR